MSELDMELLFEDELEEHMEDEMLRSEQKRPRKKARKREEKLIWSESVWAATLRRVKTASEGSIQEHINKSVY